MARRKNVKLSDIAEKLGISVVTVSKGMANKEGVSAELKEKIRLAAVELGYNWKPSEKRVKTSINKTVGVVIPARFMKETNSFYWNMYNYVAAELMKYGYYCLMELLSPQGELDIRMPSMVITKKVDAVIVLGQVSDAYVSELNNRTLPIVFLDFYNAFLNTDSVVSDSFYDMFLLTNYLISQGHKDIKFVGTFKSTSSIQDRFLGFMKAMLQNNLPVSLDDVIDDRDDDSNFIPLELPEKMPTAFVCNADSTAHILIKALKEKGYSVPEDISVVGFDNYLGPDYENLDLTTSAVDSMEMAKSAVEIILAKLEGRSYKVGRTVIGGKIILRGSVKSLKEN